MMDGRQAAEARVVLHFHVTTEQHVVGDRNSVFDDAIVSDVATRHDQVMVPDPGDPVPHLSSAVNRDVFANTILVTNNYPAVFSKVLLVLWLSPDHGSREHFVVGTNDRIRHNRDVVVQTRTITDATVRPDVAELAELNVSGDLSRGMDEDVVVAERNFGSFSRRPEHCSSSG